LTDKDMLSKAVIGREVFVEIRQSSTEARWAVCRNGFVLNANDKWEYEPMPSSRSEEFLARTRFGLDDAWSRARECLNDQGHD